MTKYKHNLTYYISHTVRYTIYTIEGKKDTKRGKEREGKRNVKKRKVHLKWKLREGMKTNEQKIDRQTNRPRF
jgi:hypothetical protein